MPRRGSLKPPAEPVVKPHGYDCEVPEGVMYLTAGVDTQDDRFEIDVVGWGPDYEMIGRFF